MEASTVTALKCTVERVYYSKDQFAICECRTKGKIPDDAIRSFSDEDGSKTFTALGTGLSTQMKQTILLSGKWEPNQKFHYPQLRIHDCVDYIGHSRKEIVSYLSSNILKGIGKKTAERIYDTFGEKSIEVIETDPQQLLTIPGIKEKKLEQIVSSFEAHRDFHNLTMLLSKYDVGYRTIVRIQRALGENATKTVRENPYTLCRVSGFGFKTADALAMEMGVPGDSPHRIIGAVAYALDNAQNEGHVYLTRKQLIANCCSEKVLNNASSGVKITPQQVDDAISVLIKNEVLIQVRPANMDIPPEDAPIYRESAYTHETFAARKIAEKISNLKVRQQNWSRIVAETELALGVTLDEKQAEAAIMGLGSPLSVITGGPGTGKTTSLNVIVQAYLKLYPKKEVALAAPTGRAARRMAEQTNMEASTIHSLLGLTPDSKTNFDQPCLFGDMVEADLLIIDESSMIDAHLLAELMYRVKDSTQVIFLGDADQLPSVGAGNVLSQLLHSDIVPSVKLEKIFRQSEDSVIPVNAANIRQGIQDLTYNKYFRFIQCENEQQGAEAILQLMQRAISRGTDSNVQILCPMKKRGAASTGSLNAMLHDIANPPAPAKAEAYVAGVLFREGDKVMQTRNIDGASNGDIGYIVHIDANEDDKENFSLVVQFDTSPKPLEFGYDDALDLVHALAITIHKSQGSEFDAVIIPMFSSMSFFLRRNLLYTAVTRAKKQVIIVSDGPGIQSAIQKEDTSKRNTLLSNFVFESFLVNR